MLGGASLDVAAKARAIEDENVSSADACLWLWHFLRYRTISQPGAARHRSIEIPLDSPLKTGDTDGTFSICFIPQKKAVLAQVLLAAGEGGSLGLTFHAERVETPLHLVH
jgi:hypothetical protein